MSNNLKPCPFCGNKSPRLVDVKVNDCFVYCTDCFVNTRMYPPCTREDAIVSWNRRVEHCYTCKHFDDKGYCNIYQSAKRPNDTCKDWRENKKRAEFRNGTQSG